MAKKWNIVEIAERFGNERALRVFRQRRFRNKKRAEERKTGQKSFGFNKGGLTDYYKDLLWHYQDQLHLI